MIENDTSSIVNDDHLVLYALDMLAHSPKARSRSPHRTNGNQTESSTVNDLNNHDVNTTNNKSKKDNESQLRMKSLKVRINIQRWIH